VTPAQLLHPVDLPLEVGDRTRRSLVVDVENHLCGAVSQRRQAQVHSDTGEFLDRDRQQVIVGLQVGLRGTTLGMKQHDGVFATLLQVAGEHVTQAHAVITQVRVQVTNRTRRANRGATAPALAQVGIDFNDVAQALNRFRRAGVETLPARDLAVDRMRADRRIVVKIPGFLKFAPQFAELRDYFGIIPGGGRQVKVSRR